MRTSSYLYSLLNYTFTKKGNETQLYCILSLKFIEIFLLKFRSDINHRF